MKRMNKIVKFAIIFGTSIVGLIVSLYIISVTYASESSNDFMSTMMEQMMGGNGGMNMSGTSIPYYVWVFPTLFLAIMILGIVGLIYFSIVPEIKLFPQLSGNLESQKSNSVIRSSRLSTVKSTMKPEEKKVLEILSAKGGKYLQKHISKEANLSRLKTHRIISRFADRGIVTVRQFGNTKEVAISDWILSEE
jgi:uncharacterized membrane protein